MKTALIIMGVWFLAGLMIGPWIGAWLRSRWNEDGE